MTRATLQALPSAYVAWRASPCSPACPLPVRLWSLLGLWVPLAVVVGSIVSLGLTAALAMRAEKSGHLDARFHTNIEAGEKLTVKSALSGLVVLHPDLCVAAGHV